MWDTVGQERFNAITTQYFRKSDACILVYDVQDKQSVVGEAGGADRVGLVPWITDVLEHRTSAAVPVWMVLGNKSDRGHDQKAYEAADELCAAQLGSCIHRQVSAVNSSPEFFARVMNDVAATLLKASRGTRAGGAGGGGVNRDNQDHSIKLSRNGGGGGGGGGGCKC